VDRAAGSAASTRELADAAVAEGLCGIAGGAPYCCDDLRDHIRPYRERRWLTRRRGLRST
jgi:hypothetical protein